MFYLLNGFVYNDSIFEIMAYISFDLGNKIVDEALSS